MVPSKIDALKGIVFAICCLCISGYVLVSNYNKIPVERSIADNKKVDQDPLKMDYVMTDRLNEMSDLQLTAMIESNPKIVVKLEEQLGTSTDNSYTRLREQIRIFIGQVDNARVILKKRKKDREDVYNR